MKKQNNSMHQGKLQEEYEEAFIKLTLAQFAEYEGQQLVQENENLKNDPFYQPTAAAKQRFNKIVSRHYYRQKGSHLLQITLANKRIAVVILIILLLSSSLFTVEAIRIRVLNLIIDIQEKYTQLHLKEEDSLNIVDSILDEEWIGAYAPTVIPDGFEIVDSEINRLSKSIDYRNLQNEIIIYQELHEQSIINIDTENADFVEEIVIQGFTGLFVQKQNQIAIAWNNDARIFIISAIGSTLQKEDIVKMAESIEINQ